MTRRCLPSSLLFAAVQAIAFSACSNEPRPPAEPAPEEAPAPSPAPPAEPLVERPDPTPEELPIAEDFQEQSVQQITDDNFKAQLDAIEKEMDVEQP